MAFNMLPPMWGNVAEPAAPTFETTEWQLPGAVGDGGGSDANTWTNPNNVLTESDATLATRSFASGNQARFYVKDFNFSIPAGAIPYAYDIQIRWRSTRIDSDMFAPRMVNNVSEFITGLGTSPPAAPDPSTSLRTDTLQMSTGRITSWFIDNASAIAHLNASDQAEVRLSFGQPSDTGTSTISIAWVKMRVRYLMPAVGNTLEWQSNLVGTGANISAGGTAWTNPGNITADDSTNANCDIGKGGTTNILRGTNPGHTVPASAVLVGLLLEADVGNLSFNTCDFELVGFRDGTSTFNFIASASMQDEVEEWAGSFSGSYPVTQFTGLLRMGTVDPTFIANFTVAEVNSSGFGADMRWSEVSGFLNNPANALVDYYRTRVLYSRV